MYDFASASISVNFSMFGSFLYSSEIASFHDLATVGCSVVEEIGCSVCCGASVVGCVVSATGTASCVICSCDITIFLFHYHFVALI
jgi:hypothetical protein